MTKSKSINLKTIMLTALLLLIVFCLVGCSQVNFVTYHNSDGSINEYVYITLDEQQVTQLGYNVTNVELEIKTNSYSQAQQLVSEYRAKLYEEYLTKKLTNQDYTDYYKGVNIIEQQWQDGKYVIGLKYDNSNCYKKYYNLLNGSTFSSKGKEVKKTFYTKTYYYGTAGYGDYTIFNRIYNYYANTVFASISPQNNKLTYSYAVSSRRMHSDADSVKLDSNGNYIHTWNVSPNEPARKICFYTISANRSVWIIACIAIGLVVTVVLCFIGIFVYNRNKKLNKETNDSDLTNHVE